MTEDVDPDTGAGAGPLCKPLFADLPPSDGREWECQCGRCGSSVDFEECWNCGGERFSGHDCGEDCCCCLDPEENVVCDVCRGRGGWDHCISSSEWCQANPIPGREHVERGIIEWFPVS